MKTRTTFTSLIGLAVTLPALACGDTGLTAHEWGTFTSVQGADGIQLEWNPFTTTDLPSFVYDRARAAASGWRLGAVDVKGNLAAIVRMETPVIYFYSSIPRTADVHVDFPQGRITEWYPQATALGPFVSETAADKAMAQRSFIEWKGVKILPHNTTEITADNLIREKADTHYYAARETAANLLRIDAPRARTEKEYDRVLFYRGVGRFPAPLQLRSDDSGELLSLGGTRDEPLSDLFVLTIRGGQARFRYVDKIEPAEPAAINLAGVPFAPLSDVREKVMKEMRAALERQGLFAPEAQAMVNTWKDQWFAEEGTRVLYLLPRAWTDRTLPLDINPRPNKLVRVMVGRSELLEPSAERGLAHSIAAFRDGDAMAKQRAIADVQQLGFGRFLQPAVSHLLRSQPERDFINAAWKLASEVDRATKKTPTIADKPALTPEKRAQINESSVSFAFATAGQQ